MRPHSMRLNRRFSALLQVISRSLLFHHWIKQWNSLGWFMLALLVAIALHSPIPVLSATVPHSQPPSLTLQHATTPQQADQQGRIAYQEGRLAEAVEWFQQAIALSAGQEPSLEQAMTWGNLALAHHHLGNWQAANAAIAQSLAQIQTRFERETTTQLLSMQAQALDIEAQILLAQGQAEAALQRWEQTATLYEQLENPTGYLQSQIGQSRALQHLGFYRRAIALLENQRSSLDALPNSELQVAGLQRLGNTLQQAGDLMQARQVLEQALAIATELGLTDAVADLHLSLGNTLRGQGDVETALTAYRQAESATTREGTRLRAQLNQFTLLLGRVIN